MRDTHVARFFPSATRRSSSQPRELDRTPANALILSAHCPPRPRSHPTPTQIPPNASCAIPDPFPTNQNHRKKFTTPTTSTVFKQKNAVSPFEWDRSPVGGWPVCPAPPCRLFASGQPPRPTVEPSSRPPWRGRGCPSVLLAVESPRLSSCPYLAPGLPLSWPPRELKPHNVSSIHLRASASA